MNILAEYTLDYVRRNKKSSVAILIAILIATTLLSALCGFLHTMYTDEIRLTIHKEGNWHAELFDDTPGDKLKYVTGHPNVEQVMIKGPWEVAQIEDPRRPYLVMRGLTSSYWSDMPERQHILEGRIPHHPGELALSKQYFEHHPDLKVGDTIRLPVGSRVLNGETLESRSIYKKGERFVPTAERSYTVVGKLDITTNSTTPAYLAYGYLDEASMTPEDKLTIYMRFNNPGTAYEDIVEIARSVGYKPDEYGDYMVRTNSSLLAKYFVFPSGQGGQFQIWQFSWPLMFAAMALLVTGLFVVIISNAFAISANARLRQLGILQSIGASPKQIRRSVILESLILSVISIPLGLFFGWLLDFGLFAYISSQEKLREVQDIRFTFGLPAVLPSVLLALLTVWLSASIPARKISKMSPIDAIRQGGEIRVKKLRKPWLSGKLFGIEGELAKNALRARKKSYRTAVISLTLSFCLLSGFLHMFSILEVANTLFREDSLHESEENIALRILDGNVMDPQMEEQIRSVPGVKSALFVSHVPAAMWVKEDRQSEALAGIGGFSRIADSGQYSLYEENGSYRLQTNLVALDDQSFAEYSRRIGADARLFYDKDVPRTIVVNQVRDDLRSNRRETVHIPFLKLRAGERLNLEEKVYSEDKGSYTFTTEVAYLTDEMPPLGDRYDNNFELVQIMPSSVYLGIVGQMAEERAIRARYVSIPVVAESADRIERVTAELKNVVDRWYGSGDYEIWNIIEIKESGDKGRQMMKFIIVCVSGFLALIGISNVFSTVSGNLRQRQKEFAVLRSVGISPRGIGRMLLLEALLFGLIPILLSIPVTMLIIWSFLKINMVYLGEFLPHMPVLELVLFAALIIISVVLAYILGGRRLKQGTIVDVLKDETV
ncbi:ABC transporter permease [Paenibacillus sanfengchensis]|uniref:ABC transporter permease n=1 Tax=Paenibacillus sanfengchensis TaxID=3119819 RepID=UPI002FDFCD4E